MTFPLFRIFHSTIVTVLCLTTAAQAQVIFPKSGDYYGQGTMTSRSHRSVRQQGNRICLSTVNGPASPYEGFLEINVSSLFVRGNEIYRVGDQESISINKDGESIGSGPMRFYLSLNTPKRKIAPE